MPAFFLLSLTMTGMALPESSTYYVTTHPIPHSASFLRASTLVSSDFFIAYTFYIYLNGPRVVSPSIKQLLLSLLLAFLHSTLLLDVVGAD